MKQLDKMNEVVEALDKCGVIVTEVSADLVRYGSSGETDGRRFKLYCYIRDFDKNEQSLYERVEKIEKLVVEPDPRLVHMAKSGSR